MSELNPLQPPKPKAVTGAPPAPPPAALALDKAQRRASLFAQLAADPLFQSEFVDGFLFEAEQTALHEVATCEIADLARARDQWVNTMDLRTRIYDEMNAAPATLKRLQTPATADT